MALEAKKMGNGHHLADAHETLACFYDQSDGQREGGKGRRPQNGDDQHPQQGQRVPVYMHAERGGDGIDDDRLRYRPQGAGQRFAQRQRAPGGGGDQELVHDAQVALPDDGHAAENSHEHAALRQYAGGDEIYIGCGAGGDGPGSGHHLAVDDQPQRRLYGAHDELAGVVAQLARFQRDNNISMFNKGKQAG